MLYYFNMATMNRHLRGGAPASRNAYPQTYLRTRSRECPVATPPDSSFTQGNSRATSSV